MKKKIPDKGREKLKATRSDYRCDNFFGTRTITFSMETNRAKDKAEGTGTKCWQRQSPLGKKRKQRNLGDAEYRHRLAEVDYSREERLYLRKTASKDVRRETSVTKKRQNHWAVDSGRLKRHAKKENGGVERPENPRRAGLKVEKGQVN